MLPSTISENWKIDHTHRLCESYLHFFKTPLLASLNPTFEELFHSPLILLSHGTQSDPILNFGNQAALTLWELSWEELTQMPSRLTAEPMEREARAAFMNEVRTHGFLSNYAGIRVSKSGRRFKIENAKVWNLIDRQNQLTGQAACFSQWSYL